MSSVGPEHIVQMANDIGNFFRSETDRKVALEGISNHINKFWTRRMRQRLLEYVQHGAMSSMSCPWRPWHRSLWLRPRRSLQHRRHL